MRRTSRRRAQAAAAKRSLGRRLDALIEEAKVDAHDESEQKAAFSQC